MTDTKKCCCASIVLIVLLRLSIGWQFLYEGLWKINTLNTPTPWSAEGYLKNAQGPLRNTFRNMTGDPNDLDWLDKDKVAAKWDDWANRFAGHYQMDDKQQVAQKVTFSKSVDMRGNDDVSWSRAVRYLARDMAEKRERNPRYAQ